MYPIPGNEAVRLAALDALDIVGTPPDTRFDAICRTAAALFRLPISLVSLVERDRQWFKAKCGFAAQETARGNAFCSYAIMEDSVFVVEDARLDARFREKELVTQPPYIRFYAGAPLIIGQDIRVGTICVLGLEPRRFSADERMQLADLATIVSAQLSLHRVESQLRDSEAHYRLLAENTSDMIVRSSLDSTRHYVSPASRTLLGYEAEELIGTKPIAQVHPEDSEAYEGILADLREGRVDHVVARQRYRHKDGTWVWVEVNFNVTHDPLDGRPSGYVASVRDISERKDAERRIAHMARHDALTDLANRTLFRERLLQEIAARRRGRKGAKADAEGFAILSLDLDRFKAVNDSFGHQAGDTLLRIVAERLRAVVRVEDTVARIGGDEFTIIQTAPTQPENSQILSRRLIDAIREPIVIEGRRVDVGVSIGIALAAQDDADADELCRQADLALYRAKVEGRNTYRLYEPGMRFAGSPIVGLNH